MPETQTYREKQRRWITGDAYVGIIDYDHPSLKLTFQEKRSLGIGLRQIHEKWPAALARPLMPEAVLTEQVVGASQRTRQRARPMPQTTADMLSA